MQAKLSLPVKTIREINLQAPLEAVPVVPTVSRKKLKNPSSLHRGLAHRSASLAGGALKQFLPAIPAVLVGIASGWPPFLKNAGTMFTSEGFDPDCLALGDAAKPGWQSGLNEVAAVVATP